MNKIDLKSMYRNEVEEYAVSLGEKKYRGGQLFDWMHKGIFQLDHMTNLPKDFRDKISQDGCLETVTIEKVQQSKNDGTRKYLFRLLDGHMVETVFMKYKFGNSICISSQAGCKMGCRFCASAENGLSRNLTAGEMVDQVLKVQEDAGERIARIVVMGTGEPFDNYDQLLRFLRIMNEPKGLNIGLRNMTVSTCGVIPKMQQFAKDMPQVNLAVSLHAPNEGIRNKIMPISTKYPYMDLLRASREYANQTKRQITFEYVLLDGVNDSTSCAKELAKNLRGMLCHVNLIPFNGVKEKAYTPTSKVNTEKFKECLEQGGIEATIRRELGSDIDAACGQLRNSQSQ